MSKLFDELLGRYAQDPELKCTLRPGGGQLSLHSLTSLDVELVRLPDGRRHIYPDPPLIRERTPVSLMSLTWDVTGAPRIALLWQMESASGQVSQLVEVHASESDTSYTDVLWAVDGEQLRPQLEVEQEDVLHLHLLGDTLRILDRQGVHQIHRSGYHTFQAFERTAELHLTPLSGEVRSGQLKSDNPLASPRGLDQLNLATDEARHFEVGQDNVRTSVPDTSIPDMRRWLPGEHSGDVSGLPLWTQDTPMFQAAPAIPARTVDLKECAEVFRQRGWRTEGSVDMDILRVGLDRPGRTTVAEMWQRPEGTCALLTSWRGLWPIRWEVWPHGSAQEAVIQVEQALTQDWLRVHHMPPEEYLPAVTELPNSTESAVKPAPLLSGSDGNDADLAQALLWIQSTQAQLTLTYPPVPLPADWTKVEQFCLDGRLPYRAMRPVLRALPFALRKKLFEFYAEELESDADAERWLSEARAEPTVSRITRYKHKTTGKLAGKYGFLSQVDFELWCLANLVDHNNYAPVIADEE